MSQTATLLLAGLVVVGVAIALILLAYNTRQEAIC
jgi:hypothetical protein